MPNLLLDGEGLPEPQYKSQDGTTYESQKGKEGASYTYVKDGHSETLGSKDDAASTTSVVGLLKNIGNSLGSAVTALGSIVTSLDSVVTSLTGTLTASISGALPAGTNKIGTVSVDNQVHNIVYDNTALYGAISLVAATPTELKVGTTALSGRKQLEVINTSTDTSVYIGFDSAVTELTGFPIAPGESKVFKLDAANPLTVYAIATAALDLRVIEG